MQELGENEEELGEILSSEESKPSNLFKLVEFFEKSPYKVTGDLSKNSFMQFLKNKLSEEDGIDEAVDIIKE